MREDKKGLRIDDEWKIDRARKLLLIGLKPADIAAASGFTRQAVINALTPGATYETALKPVIDRMIEERLGEPASPAPVQPPAPPRQPEERSASRTLSFQERILMEIVAMSASLDDEDRISAHDMISWLASKKRNE